MIDIAEISTRAQKLRLDHEHIEKDHLMCCILAAIADGGSLLVFRGGTALARVYWPDFRLSEDLDFITGSPAADVRASLERAVAVAARVAGIDLILDYGQPKGGWSRSYVRFDQASILIDVNLGEKAYLPLEDGVVDLPYSDLRGGERRVPVIALAEILGNKWFLLGDDDRREPRDLYDVWAGITRFGVPFSSSLVAIAPITGSVPRMHSSPERFDCSLCGRRAWLTNLRSYPASRMRTRLSLSGSRSGRRQAPRHRSARPRPRPRGCASRIETLTISLWGDKESA